MTAERIDAVPGVTIGGTPDQLAQELAENHVLELAKIVKMLDGPEGLLEYYTALTTCALCQARVFLGDDAARLIGELCTRNVLAADAPRRAH